MNILYPLALILLLTGGCKIGNDMPVGWLVGLAGLILFGLAEWIVRRSERRRP